MLEGFDQGLATLGDERGLVNTRYFDDIVISGRSREGVQQVVEVCIDRLSALRLPVARRKVNISQGRFGGLVHGLRITPRLRVSAAFRGRLGEERARVAAGGSRDRLEGLLAYDRQVETEALRGVRAASQRS